MEPHNNDNAIMKVAMTAGTMVTEAAVVAMLGFGGHTGQWALQKDGDGVL